MMERWWEPLGLPRPLFQKAFANKWPRFANLICSPANGSSLRLDGDWLIDADGNRFPVWNGIPLLSRTGLMSRSWTASCDAVLPAPRLEPGVEVYVGPFRAIVLDVRSPTWEPEALGCTILQDGGFAVRQEDGWVWAKLEVEIRRFDRLEQVSKFAKLRDSRQVAELVPPPLLVHGGFQDLVVQEIIARSSASWPGEPLDAEVLRSLTSKSAQRGRRLAGIPYRDANLPYFASQLQLLGRSPKAATIWSCGAGYLSDVLISAGVERVVNCDERLATLPAVVDQGDDEISIWADPLNWPVRDFDFFLSHRHTVLSRMEVKQLRKQIALAGSADTIYLSIYSDMSGRSSYGWAQLSLKQIFDCFAANGLHCARFASLGANLSFWLTRSREVVAHVRSQDKYQRIDLIRLRLEDRRRYYAALSIYCGHVVSEMFARGLNGVVVAGDTVIDQDLRIVLGTLSIGSSAKALTCGTAVQDDGPLALQPSFDAQIDGFPFHFHSGDGDEALLSTAHYYLQD